MTTAQVTEGTPNWRRPLRRIEWVLDQSGMSQSESSRYLRVVLGVLCLVYGVIVLALEIEHDDLRPVPVLFLLLAVPLFSNRLGSFGRYLLPVFLGLFAYGQAASVASKLRLPVHYELQVRFDRHLTGTGALPTAWLQQHLYHGHAGPVEAVAVAAYAGHFIVPLALGTGLVVTGRIGSFHLLMYSLLTVAVAGMIVFILVPTAPPWLAAQDGYVTGVQHILKGSLYEFHMTSLARMEGNGKAYDITAAVPSLHTAFPVICLLTAIQARLPRPVIAALALNLVAVVFSIVYTGEHYVFDALVGSGFAAAAWLLVRKLDLRATTRAEAMSASRASA